MEVMIIISQNQRDNEDFMAMKIKVITITKVANPMITNTMLIWVTCIKTTKKLEATVVLNMGIITIQIITTITIIMAVVEDQITEAAATV